MRYINKKNGNSLNILWMNFIWEINMINQKSFNIDKVFFKWFKNIKHRNKTRNERRKIISIILLRL